MDAEGTVGSFPIGRIDQYELVRELGGGGFGCVYLARDTVAGVEVAVKGLPPEVKHNREELENIRENFALVSRLHHPNIAAALVLHPVRKTFYAAKDAMEKLRVFEGDMLQVMEYAPGMTLSSWRKRFPGKRVPLDAAVDIVRQIASALDYAHERKIIHRDVKPANVMIEPTEGGKNVIRVLDFGLAAEIRSSMGRVSREIRDMSGTRPYMAPEQWAGEKQGPATDQYALAVLFCELVSGEVPHQSVFESGDAVAMMANVIHQPAGLPEAIPDAARKALQKALSKKPSDRYPTCGAFAEALCRRPFPWAMLCVVLLSLAVVGALVWRLARRTPPTRNEAPAVEVSPLPERTNGVPYLAHSAMTNDAPTSVAIAVTNERLVRAPIAVTHVPPVRVPPVEPKDAPSVSRDSVPVVPEPPSVERFPLSKACASGRCPYGTDYGRAFHRLLRAAALGDADAQYCLGWLYSRGLGVGASPDQARRCWRKSAAKGNPYAVQALENVEE